MTRIKICGLTNIEDAQAAIAYGADLLGFIGVPKSPRYLDTQMHWEVNEDIGPFVQKVIVVEKPEDAEEYGFDFIQFYSDPAPDFSLISLRDNDWPIKAFRVKDEASLEEIRNYSRPAAAFLLDAYHENKLGGSGETFNWDLAIAAKALTNKPLILAGGLTPDNVQDALEAVRPFAVDVSSGIELSPGIKDHAKIKAFIKAVREWDLRQE